MSRSAASEGRFEEANAFLDTVESLESRNPDPTVEKHDLKAERHSISQLQEAAKLAQKKSRLMTDIRAALNRRNFDRSRGLIRDALLEFPGDEELSSLQERCSQLEDASIQAIQLFHDGRTHIQLGNHEVGMKSFDALDNWTRTIGIFSPRILMH
jgi:hypothetical protein